MSQNRTFLGIDTGEKEIKLILPVGDKAYIDVVPVDADMTCERFAYVVNEFVCKARVKVDAVGIALSGAAKDGIWTTNCKYLKGMKSYDFCVPTYLINDADAAELAGDFEIETDTEICFAGAAGAAEFAKIQTLSAA